MNNHNSKNKEDKIQVDGIGIRLHRRFKSHRIFVGKNKFRNFPEKVRFRYTNFVCSIYIIKRANYKSIQI